jgi:arylsulfatase
MSHAIRIAIFSCVILTSCSNFKKDDRPNVLLIVADDLGYADLGCFGSDIRTPNIDKIATEGIRFTQFHTSPYCAPTRAMLLSGNNNHVAGMGRQGGAAKDSWEEGKPGYEGHLSDRIVPMPLLLRDAGYHTYMIGKWHLGKQPDQRPDQKGFERSFTLLQGGANHYNNIGLIASDSVSQYIADGSLVEYPTGKYSTEFYTDKLMEFIKSNPDGKPFFAYAAYTSPHWPLQAPAENDKYHGAYDMGYDSLRALRFESLKRAGIIPPSQVLPPRLATIKPWKALTAKEKKIESRKMELYAAMVDNLDSHVGRLIQFLKDQGLYENTVIIFMSDNGAAAEDFYNTPPYSDFIAPHYDNRLENMGTPSSFISYGPPWAKAGAAPFSHHKSYPTEGGIVAPMIIRGGNLTATNVTRDDFLTVMDIAPTILELAGANFPGDYASEKVQPMLGSSMREYLWGNGNVVHDSTYAIGLEHGGRAYFRKGAWKIVNLEPPHRESTFVLYNLKADPAEVTNLAPRNPEKLAEMIQEWRKYREEHGILVAPEDVKNNINGNR